MAAASYNSGDYGICTAARPLAIQTEAAYVARFLRSLLPPKRKRGRPGIASVTKAILLLKKFKHQYPTEKPEQIWKRIYPEAIPGYTSMDPERQKAERLLLRDEYATVATSIVEGFQDAEISSRAAEGNFPTTDHYLDSRANLS